MSERALFRSGGSGDRFALPRPSRFGGLFAAAPPPSSAEPPFRFSEKAAFGLLLLAALLARLVPVLFVPSMVWPDEIFQATEQAHRLVYGTGIEPWEFELAVRSWLLPGAIAGLMELARLFGEGPRIYLPVIAVAFAALAAAPVACAYLWARRFYGVAAAFVAGAAVAAAPEVVYFAGRTLSEAVSGNLLLVALYLLEPGYAPLSRGRLVAAGALFALVFALRIELAPALAAIGLWTLWKSGRERLLPLLAGAALVLLAVGLLDGLTLGYPFASLWRYVIDNAQVSSTFGVKPWDFYFLLEYGVWGMAIALPLLLAALGARRTPLLALCALLILLSHMAVPHKEYRFVYPAILLVAVLAGLGLGECARLGAASLRQHGRRAGVAALVSSAAAVLPWLLIAGRVWAAPNMTALRYRDHDFLLAASFVANGPDPCGIAVYARVKNIWGASGGYTYLQKPVPLYWPKDRKALLADGRAFDTLVYLRPSPALPQYKTAQCFGTVCVARRSGLCRPRPMAAMPVPRPLIPLAKAENIPVPRSASGRRRRLDRATEVLRRNRDRRE